MTYLYYTTVRGLPEVVEKAVLIPTAHDEPYIYSPIYRKLFEIPKALIFLTEEEKSFVRVKFNNTNVSYDVIGLGIDNPEKFQDEKGGQKAVSEFRQKYHISGKYVIYAGRVAYGKNCDEM